MVELMNRQGRVALVNPTKIIALSVVKLNNGRNSSEYVVIFLEGGGMLEVITSMNNILKRIKEFVEGEGL